MEQPQKLPDAYKVWLAGALTAQLGSAAMHFALGWAAAAHGSTAAGLVISLVVLPRTLLLLFGGVIGDRVGARRVMIACNAGMIAVMAGLALFTGLSGTPLALLLAAALLIGVNDAFYLPSSGSMPRRLVDRPLLGKALALKQSGTQTISIVGGPLGGALVGLAGFAAAAWGAMATFAVVLIVVILIRPRFTPPKPKMRSSLVREAVDGVRIAFTTPGLGAVLVMVAAASGFVLPVGALLVPLLARSQDLDAGAAGVIVGSLGAGTVLVSLLVAKVGTHTRLGPVACAGMFGAAAGIVLIAASPTLTWTVVGALATGAGSGVFITHLTPILLSAAPETHLARVQALFSLVQSMSVLITMNILGYLADRAGPEGALLMCAAVLAACALVGLSSRRVRKLT